LAVDSVFPQFGAGFLAVSLFFFCFTTLLSYYYKAETNLAFLTQSQKTKSRWPNHVLKVVLLITSFYGSVNTAAVVWAMGDLGMGAMAWVNLSVIFLLIKPALRVLKDYEMQKKVGKDPVFNPAELGIKDAEFWEEKYKEMQGNKPVERKLYL
ncbi:alanine:cation symporter family protein, partial [Peribacillus frigoritolerans]